jgi:hypothetical protein
MVEIRSNSTWYDHTRLLDWLSWVLDSLIRKYNIFFIWTLATTTTTTTTTTTAAPTKILHLFFDFFFFGNLRNKTSNNQTYMNKAVVLAVLKSYILVFDYLSTYVSRDGDSIFDDKLVQFCSFSRWLCIRRPVDIHLFNFDQ